MEFLKYASLIMLIWWRKGDLLTIFWNSNLYHMQEKIPFEKVCDHLKCTGEGLGSEERLDFFGYNKLEEKKVKSEIFDIFHFWSLFQIICLAFDNFWMLLQESKIIKFLGFMWNPLSWLWKLLLSWPLPRHMEG